MCKVKLLGAWPSSYVWRVQVALNIKSVHYEFVEDLMNGKSELLLKSNPVYKRIHVLIHNDKTICESMIITQYIDEAWSSGPSILPSDPYNRVVARFWAAYMDDKRQPDFGLTVQGESEEARKAAAEKVRENFVVLEEAFVQCSKGKSFFGGDHMGYIDIALGCYLNWVKASEMLNNLIMLDEAKTPNLFKWAERFCSDDAAKGVMPKPEKLVEMAHEVLVPKPRA